MNSVTMVGGRAGRSAGAATGSQTLSEKHAQAALRLDRLPTKSLTFACGRCGRSITVAVADLCSRFGTDRSVKTIEQDVLACKDKAWRRDDGECPISYRA
jgi:hypothetical protein